MPVSLDEILASTRRLIPPLHQRRADLERAAAEAPVSRSLATALQGEAVAVIAEVKRRSPQRRADSRDSTPPTRCRRVRARMGRPPSRC